MSSKGYLNFIGIYIFFYYAQGALFPLLSQYLKGIGLTGSQVGMIASIGPIVAILAQPLWGMLADRTQRMKEILLFAISMPLLISLFIPQAQSYFLILVSFALLQLFQNAIGPISDTIVLHSPISFGKVRQWGAVGFAAAVFFTAIVADHQGLSWIFRFYSLSFLLLLFFISRMRVERIELKSNVFEGLQHLIKLPRFTLFLICGFLMNGPINGNNIFFGLLYEHLGGGITGIGVAFLLFAGSEAPFMKWTNTIMQKFGTESVLGFALILSSLRWFWYSSSPDPKWVILFFFLQGISYGFFIVGAAEYIRENTTSEYKVTAMSIYGSLAMGLGAVACQLIGGSIYDVFGIVYVYRFFGFFTLAAIIPLLIIQLGFKTENNPVPVSRRAN